MNNFNGAAASKTIYQAEDSGFPEAIARDIIATEFTLVSLRLNVFISSIAPAEVVIPQALDSDTAILVKNKANDLRFPRGACHFFYKQLCLVSRQWRTN